MQSLTDVSTSLDMTNRCTHSAGAPCVLVEMTGVKNVVDILLFIFKNDRTYNNVVCKTLIVCYFRIASQARNDGGITSFCFLSLKMIGLGMTEGEKFSMNNAG